MSAAAAVPPARPPLVIASPLTGERLAVLPDPGAEGVAAAMARARAAAPGWAALGFAERGRRLRALARRVRDDRELLETLIAESGKPRFEAEGWELLYLLEVTRFYTSRFGRRALADEWRRPFLFAHKRARVVWHPRGVVGVIGPWNFPLINNFGDAVAPLLAGNAVLLKPSELTPLSSLRIARLAREVGIAEGVLEVVVGGREAGMALARSADLVFFTGSVAAGREVALAAAERLVPVVLELGGKSAMIVCGDADVERAARAAVWSGFAASGQICIRTERVYVVESVAERFERRVAELTRELSATGRDGDLGALTSPSVRARAEAQIADAVARGARRLTGDEALPPALAGRSLAATVLAGCSDDMQVMREETFGPVLPIRRVRDEEEALGLANALPFGLGGSVWTRDPARGMALARRLETGSVCINDAMVQYFCVEAPLGGIKRSGLGHRHGAEALRQFCRAETILEDRPWLRWLAPHLSREIGFPYSPRAARALRAIMRWVYR